MKHTKFAKILFQLLLLVCLLTVLCACDTPAPAEPTSTEPTSGDAAYRVTVKDALGTPYTTGIVVRFLEDGQQKAMQVVDASGVAEKTLPRSNYTVELSFTDNADLYYYDAAGLELTAEKTETEVILSYRTSGGTSLFAGGSEYTAYSVSAGSTYVELADGRNYFLFTPREAGTYAFSVTDPTAAVGYYGAPHFVQSISAAEVVDNCFTVSVSASMIGTGDTGTTVIVIGVDKGEQPACLLTVQRTGDPKRTLEDEPWIIYKATAVLTPCDLGGETLTFTEFDLTAETDAYTLVWNEADGFYHLGTAEGPVVYVRLGKDTKYLPCFKTMLDRSGVVKYFFDENEEFVKKESYSECLLEYIANMDSANGVYPLTEDLKYIIQQRGEFAGWFDPSSSVYIFQDAAGTPISGINPDLAWLFMCCYLPVN